MIISDLSVLEAVEESANIQGGDSPFLPVVIGFPPVSIPATNTASASANALASNPFSNTSSPGIIGVSVSSTLAQTQALTALGGSSQSTSVSQASISFVPGAFGAPLLLNFPLTVSNL